MYDTMCNSNYCVIIQMILHTFTAVEPTLHDKGDHLTQMRKDRVGISKTSLTSYK